MFPNWIAADESKSCLRKRSVGTQAGTGVHLRSVLRHIVVGGRHFWLSVWVDGPPYILYAYLTYRVYTLCIHTTIYIFGGPPEMSQTRPPTTMLRQHLVKTIQAADLFQHFGIHG